MYGEVRKVLEGAGLDVDDVELLDALWLAGRLPDGPDAPLSARLRSGPEATTDVSRRDTTPGTTATGPHTSGSEPSDVPDPDAGTGAGSDAADDTEPDPTGQEDLAPVTGAPAADGPSGVLRLLPGGRVLGNDLVLGRALRPLKRRVPSAFRTELDEDATVAAQADTGVPNVVLRPLPERWLRLALVIDSEVSMVLWEHHCGELHAAFERSGAFRQIEIHQLRRDPPSPSGRRGSGMSLVHPWRDGRTSALPTAGLNDPSGRTLVLVITDGTAPGWRNGLMRPVLERWARAGPTAVLHVLPRHLWAGTGVTGDTWHVTVPRPGAPNSTWQVADPVLPSSIAPFDGPRVPVVELTPTGLRAWARAITTVGQPVPMRLWEPRSAAPAVRATTVGAHADAHADVRAFTRLASPRAVRLAAHLAAVSPATVPVMQLVQSCLSDRSEESEQSEHSEHSDTTALAEVFLGGLLKQVRGSGPGLSQAPAKHRLFDFTAEAKDLLLDTVPLADLMASSLRVGERMARLVGRSPDFPAWLLPFRGTTWEAAEGQPQPFARIGGSWLARLGLDGGVDRLGDEEAAREVPPDELVLVLTDLPFQHVQLLEYLTDVEELVNRGGDRAALGRLPGTAWRVALVDASSRAGSAAALIDRVGLWLGPRRIFFVGQATGLKAALRIGDVVVATEAYSIRRTRRRFPGFLVSPETLGTPHQVRQAARRALDDRPDVVFQPVAVGNAALADFAAPIAAQLREHDRDAVALELGGVGATLLDGAYEALIVLGVSDHADTESRVEAEAPGSYAASKAAEAALDVLRTLEPETDAVPVSGADHFDFRDSTFTGPAVGTALTGLPPRVSGVTGRDQELAYLLELLSPTGREGAESVHSLVVSGLAGIGKTALAVEAAHVAHLRGWFPGGVLFLDLRGYDNDAVSEEQALETMLRALGVRPEHVPPQPDERAMLYRSILTERLRVQGPVLVLLDNAVSSQQVRPLIPGGPQHRLLVTSRHRLVQLESRCMDLDVFTPGEAHGFLDRALRVADPADTRVADEAEAAAEIARLCGHLPLALQIAASLLTADRERSVAELADELAGSANRLAVLDDGEYSIRAAFDLSYRRLSADEARLLRLFAAAPGPDAGAEVLEALNGTGTVGTAPTRVLSALARAHLVQRRSMPGRWRLHSLVKAYANSLTVGDPVLSEEADAGRERVLRYFLRTADAADDRLRWLPGQFEPALFATQEEALVWLDSERLGLLAAVQWADEERFAPEAVRLAICLAGYLKRRRYTGDSIAVYRIAQRAARRTGDRLSEANAWDNLGNALRRAGRVEEAIEAHVLARDLCREIGERNSEAITWTSLGNALRWVGRVEEAIDAHTVAVELCEETGNLSGVARAWDCLGKDLLQAHRVDEAIVAHERARDVYLRIRDIEGQAYAWRHMGDCLRQVDRLEEATEAYTRSLDILRAFQDRYQAGAVLARLATVHEAAGRGYEAVAAYQEAAEAYTSADAPDEAARASARAVEVMSAMEGGDHIA
ncbi:SAV_2336 N-terminal domain-related protein [Streptomyces sp. NPDC046915]|uniref:SAV_2336 N-terminal domain-related protein n=1 Tax=Streptomyces sp. NPDC046915 TaxID=3155257 RepID=UPI00340E7E8F